MRRRVQRDRSGDARSLEAALSDIVGRDRTVSDRAGLIGLGFGSATAASAPRIKLAVLPETSDAIGAIVAACVERGATFRAVGAGTVGMRDPAAFDATVAIVCTGLRKGARIDAADRTLVAPAGLKLAEARDRLSGEGLMLPVEIEGAQTATLGGAIAAGAIGLGMDRREALRDHVVALDGFHADGERFTITEAGRDVGVPDLVPIILAGAGGQTALCQVTIRLKPAIVRQARLFRLGGIGAVMSLGHILSAIAPRGSVLEIANQPLIASSGAVPAKADAEADPQGVWCAAAWRADEPLSSAHPVLAAIEAAGARFADADTEAAHALRAGAVFSALGRARRSRMAGAPVNAALPVGTLERALGDIRNAVAEEGLDVGWRVGVRDGFATLVLIKTTDAEPANLAIAQQTLVDIISDVGGTIVRSGAGAVPGLEAAFTEALRLSDETGHGPSPHAIYVFAPPEPAL
ncbi:MAG: FAD-binding protein [Pseudomonadota bacterium]